MVLVQIDTDKGVVYLNPEQVVSVRATRTARNLHGSEIRMSNGDEHTCARSKQDLEAFFRRHER